MNRTTENKSIAVANAQVGRGEILIPQLPENIKIPEECWNYMSSFVAANIQLHGKRKRLIIPAGPDSKPAVFIEAKHKSTRQSERAIYDGGGYSIPEHHESIDTIRVRTTPVFKVGNLEDFIEVSKQRNYYRTDYDVRYLGKGCCDAYDIDYSELSISRVGSREKIDAQNLFAREMRNVQDSPTMQQAFQNFVQLIT